MITRTTLDASRLPSAAMDHRSPIWWGNLLLLVIETTMFGLLVGSYFYVHTHFTGWPPPQAQRFPPVYDTPPRLIVPSINLVVILLTTVPMMVADRSALRLDEGAVRRALLVSIALMAVAITLRFFEFDSLQFRWNDNVYGSVVWGILSMHLLHLTVETLEAVVMVTWIFAKGMDEKHARDVRTTAVYAYWVAGIWLILYVVVYLVPRWI